MLIVQVAPDIIDVEKIVVCSSAIPPPSKPIMTRLYPISGTIISGMAASMENLGMD